VTRRSVPATIPHPMHRAIAPVLLLVASCETREEKAVELVEQIAKAFSKHGEDCDTLAKELGRALDGEDDALRALTESDASEAARKRIAPYRKRIDTAVGTIVDHAAQCGSDPRVAKVVEKLL
jgi:hypothetical protein